MTLNRQLKQRAYRKRRYNKGICQRCKNKRMRGKVLCMSCTIGRRFWQRQYIHANPWVEGGRGRPPKYEAHTEHVTAAYA
jgi:hypothetical protein